MRRDEFSMPLIIPIAAASIIILGVFSAIQHQQNQITGRFAEERCGGDIIINGLEITPDEYQLTVLLRDLPPILPTDYTIYFVNKDGSVEKIKGSKSIVPGANVIRVQRKEPDPFSIELHLKECLKADMVEL